MELKASIRLGKYIRDISFCLLPIEVAEVEVKNIVLSL
jgi:hypothetical protein